MKSRGFTIIELLMATVVFSLILLVTLAGFIQIGRLFYKGTTGAQTRTVTQQVMDDITTGIKGATGIWPPPQSSGGYTYFCLDGSRYTYNINKEVDLSAGQVLLPPAAGGNYGLIKDTVSGGCPQPCVPFSTPTTCNPGAAAFFAVIKANCWVVKCGWNTLIFNPTLVMPIFTTWIWS